MKQRAIVVIAVSLAAGLGLVAGYAMARTGYPPLQVLLSTSTSVIGQELSYPAGKPKITAAIVTMKPNETTGWHRHDAPLVAWIIEGEVTIDYGPAGTKTFKAGQAFVEAFKTDHNGKNTSSGITRILAVFAGSEGVSNTVMRNRQ